MATQNQFVFDQNERQIQVLNQILMQQGLQAADEAARKAAMIDREIERLQQATATSSPLYGQNRWGDL
jgi:lipopolysaccharide assembly outer membrane protein LptD (OstA)